MIDQPKTTTFRPVGINVALVLEPIEEITHSPIIQPEAFKQPSRFARVLAVGEGTTKHTMTVKIGDRVFMSKYAGTTIEVDGVVLTVVKETDILASIDHED